ncbi:hypothetical protein A7D21_26960 [Pseudomonas sp. AP19]|uniref:hypothetical protein n=1 Tax=Pseudomonas sp. AP19 TaxID=1535623 RepID=UPI00084A4D61|nr:hypothetical protein [Pseudomonas sp. AP19]OEC62454.1 hypothetical protein A7D21_26960 [Pseudomonas sp. AP19]
MKQSSSSSTSGGIGILGLLGVLFVGLKLTGYIDWSWWYVTMPFWGGLAVAVVVIVFILIGWLLTRLLNAKR